MSIRTYNIKLSLTEEQYAFWYDTLCEVRRAYNGCSKYIKDNNIKVSLTSVHNSCYGWMRDNYNLKSQPIIEIYKDVIASYRTIKANKKHSCPQRRQLCLQLDKHLYSKLSVDGLL